MKHYDVAVIGGGVLGCFAARSLGRWKLQTILLEAAEDVCTGITRANSAIVYAGYDNHPGSLKAQMTLQGNANMGQLCEELEVPFSRCGSLMVATDPRTHRFLEKKLDHGTQTGVPGLRLLTGLEARELEPMLTDHVTGALYAPGTGTVNPWQLGIAAFENAVHNGCTPSLNTQVLGIRQAENGCILETDRDPIHCRFVINCAGLYADRVQELLFPPSIRLRWDAADYLVLDERAKKPSRVIFHQAEGCGKGITAIPCTEGNLLLSGIRRPLTEPYDTTQEGLLQLQTAAKMLLPDLDPKQIIRSFGAVRPNPYRVVYRDGQWIPDDTSLGSFCIERPAPGFLSMMGIKTPGLTCADQLGRYAAGEAAAFLRAVPNPTFDPRRTAIFRPHTLPMQDRVQWSRQNPDGSEVICLCQDVTRSEVLEAIRRGAVTVDGIKRRTGCGMGRCQGSRCTHRLEELLQISAEPLRRGTL